MIVLLLIFLPLYAEAFTQCTLSNGTTLTTLIDSPGILCSECSFAGYVSSLTGECVCTGRFLDPSLACTLSSGPEYVDVNYTLTYRNATCGCFMDYQDGFWRLSDPPSSSKIYVDEKGVKEFKYGLPNPPICNECFSEIYGPKPGTVTVNDQSVRSEACNRLGSPDPNSQATPAPTREYENTERRLSYRDEAYSLEGAWSLCSGHGYWDDDLKACICYEGWGLAEIGFSPDGKSLFSCRICQGPWGPPVIEGAQGPFCYTPWTPDPDPNPMLSGTIMPCSGHGDYIQGECHCWGNSSHGYWALGPYELEENTIYPQGADNYGEYIETYVVQTCITCATNYSMETGCKGITDTPTKSPSTSPTRFPSLSPTLSPTKSPSKGPTLSPSLSPSKGPTLSPSISPSKSPSKSPSTSPSRSPSKSPTKSPSRSPSLSPSKSPSRSPSKGPTLSPSLSPSKSPSRSPSKGPTASPSVSPSRGPTASPSVSPSRGPTTSPSKSPSVSPSRGPTASPSKGPTASPSKSPSVSPSRGPTASPSVSPSKGPTASPSLSPTKKPTSSPTPPTQSPTPPTQSPTTQSPTVPTQSPTPPTQSPTPPTSSPTTRAPTTKAPTIMGSSIYLYSIGQYNGDIGTIDTAYNIAQERCYQGRVGGCYEATSNHIFPFLEFNATHVTSNFATIYSFPSSASVYSAGTSAYIGVWSTIISNPGVSMFSVGVTYENYFTGYGITTTCDSWRSASSGLTGRVGNMVASDTNAWSTSSWTCNNAINYICACQAGVAAPTNSPTTGTPTPPPGSTLSPTYIGTAIHLFSRSVYVPKVEPAVSNATRIATMNEYCYWKRTGYCVGLPSSKIFAVISFDVGSKISDLPTRMGFSTTVPVVSSNTGMTVASSWASLVAGTLTNSLQTAGVSSNYIWTGGLSTLGSTCDPADGPWNAVTGVATYGDHTSTTSTWAVSSTISCATSNYRVLCACSDVPTPAPTAAPTFPTKSPTAAPTFPTQSPTPPTSAPTTLSPTTSSPTPPTSSPTSPTYSGTNIYLYSIGQYNGAVGTSTTAYNVAQERCYQGRVGSCYNVASNKIFPYLEFNATHIASNFASIYGFSSSSNVYSAGTSASIGVWSSMISGPAVSMISVGATYENYFTGYSSVTCSSWTTTGGNGRTGNMNNAGATGWSGGSWACTLNINYMCACIADVAAPTFSPTTATPTPPPGTTNSPTYIGNALYLYSRSSYSAMCDPSVANAARLARMNEYCYWKRAGYCVNFPSNKVFAVVTYDSTYKISDLPTKKSFSPTVPVKGAISGMEVAPSWTTFTTGTLTNSLQTAGVSSNYVWTGGLSTLGSTCTASDGPWNTQAGSATFGDHTSTVATAWAVSSTIACTTNNYRFLCACADTAPTSAPTTPTSSPTPPTQSPTPPTQSPTPPTQSPTPPTQSPTSPTKSPTSPTQSPTPPTQSPTSPTKSPTPAIASIIFYKGPSGNSRIEPDQSGRSVSTTQCETARSTNYPSLSCVSTPMLISYNSDAISGFPTKYNFATSKVVYGPTGTTIGTWSTIFSNVGGNVLTNTLTTAIPGLNANYKTGSYGSGNNHWNCYNWTSESIACDYDVGSQSSLTLSWLYSSQVTSATVSDSVCVCLSTV